MPNISFRKVDKRYDLGSERLIFNQLDLELNRGEFTVLVGPSGCGKSTLLRMVAGLESVSSGQIFFNDEEVTSLPPVERGVAMVFQNYALYAHMTVYENIGFGLKIAKVAKPEMHRLIMEAARQLHLEELLDRRPSELSGGQRQRVAIGRAIVRSPRAFLFDEPLSNLDASLRTQMRAEIAQLHRSQGATTLYVTHDQVEAMTLADRIVVLSKDGVEQVGTPDQLYDSPANLFVASFIGNHRINHIQANAENAFFIELLTGHHFSYLLQNDIYSVGVRPEQLGPVDGDCAEVFHIERLGSETLVYLRFGDASTSITMLVQDRGMEIGTKCSIGLKKGNAFLFSAQGVRVEKHGLVRPYSTRLASVEDES